MGRKRGIAGGHAVNPLQRMLGAYLRVERTRRGHTSSDIARNLGLTETYYRLVEAGKATLNQGLAIDIMSALDHSTPEQRPINFAQLCMYLVAVNLVGIEMATSSDDDDEDAGRRAVGVLRDHVAEFDDLLDGTAAYFEKEEGSPAQRRYLEEVAAPELADFLTRDRSGPGGLDSGANSPLSLADTQTLNIDAILDIIRTLSWRPFVHTPQFAAEWELSRAKDFRSLKAIYQSSRLIISEENLTEFQYGYLSSERFTKFSAMFPNEDGVSTVDEAEQRAVQLKNEFISCLESSRRKKNIYQDLTQAERDKIIFLCLTSNERKIEEKRLSSALSSEGITFEAYWSFATLQNFSIAFLARLVRLDHQRPLSAEVSTKNLILSEATKKDEQFDTLWESLHEGRKNKSEIDKPGGRRKSN